MVRYSYDIPQPERTNAPSVRRESQPLSDGLFGPDGLALDGRMAPPLDEGDVVPCSVLEQGVPPSRKVRRDAVTSLVVGTDDAAIEHGVIQGRETERNELMEGRVDRRRRPGIGECAKYGRCIAIIGGFLSGKRIGTVHVRQSSAMSR
jgi:hypothetical protein